MHLKSFQNEFGSPYNGPPEGCDVAHWIIFWILCRVSFDSLFDSSDVAGWTAELIEVSTSKRSRTDEFCVMKLPPVHPDPKRPHLFHNLYFFGAALALALLLFAWTRPAHHAALPGAIPTARK
jgi:hypothetical protein